MSDTCSACNGPIEAENAAAFKDGLRHIGPCPQREKTLGLAPEDFSPFERHKMPNGSVVYYRDSDHSYFTELKPVTKGRGNEKRVVSYSGVQTARIPSPSTIGKFADPSPDKLMDWAARKQLEGVAALADLDGPDVPWVYDAERMGSLLKAQKLTWNQLRDAKGDVGTDAHNYFEARLKGAEADPQDGYQEAVDAFLDAHPNIEPLQLEQVVYSEEHGYAGRFDARVTNGSSTYLLDLKTSKFIGRSYHQQMHGYDLAAEECGVGKSDLLRIIQVKDDGTYVAWPCRSSRTAFLHSLALYQDGKATDAECRKDYKELAHV